MLNWLQVKLIWMEPSRKLRYIKLPFLTNFENALAFLKKSLDRLTPCRSIGLPPACISKYEPSSQSKEARLVNYSYRLYPWI